MTADFPQPGPDSRLAVAELADPPDAQATGAGSELPLDREAAILHAVRHVFAEKGFDGASMQDLARAAGMSVGNFYRYFSSKSAMVEALIRADLQLIESRFSTMTNTPDPLAHLRMGLRRYVEDMDDHCVEAPLRAEIAAAALRKPELAVLVGGMQAHVTRLLTQSFAMATGLDPATAEARFAAHAQLIIMLVQGCTARTRTTPAEGADLVKLVLRQIDTLLEDIASSRILDPHP